MVSVREARVCNVGSCSRTLGPTPSRSQVAITVLLGSIGTKEPFRRQECTASDVGRLHKDTATEAVNACLKSFDLVKCCLNSLPRLGMATISHMREPCWRRCTMEILRTGGSTWLILFPQVCLRGLIDELEEVLWSTGAKASRRLILDREPQDESSIDRGRRTNCAVLPHSVATLEATRPQVVDSRCFDSGSARGWRSKVGTHRCSLGPRMSFKDRVCHTVTAFHSPQSSSRRIPQPELRMVYGSSIS